MKKNEKLRNLPHLPTPLCACPRVSCESQKIKFLTACQIEAGCDFVRVRFARRQEFVGVHPFIRPVGRRVSPFESASVQEPHSCVLRHVCLVPAKNPL